MKFDKKETHPTYGLIGWNRVSSGPPGQNLFDSPLRHQHFVSLTIRRAQRNRGLNHDWLFGNEQLIEIWMAPDQFADFLTTPNMGQGVPCTLRYVGNEDQGQVPGRVESDVFKAEIRDDLRDIQIKAQELSTKVQTILDGTNASQKKKQQVMNLVVELQREIFSNLPYMADCMYEQMGKVTTKAKASIESFIEDRIRQKGLEGLGVDRVAPKLIEGKDDEPHKT